MEKAVDPLEQDFCWNLAGRVVVVVEVSDPVCQEHDRAGAERARPTVFGVLLYSS